LALKGLKLLVYQCMGMLNFFASSSKVRLILTLHYTFDPTKVNIQHLAPI